LTSQKGILANSVTWSKLMRILVTGHNGYIGTVMVPILKQAGHDVVGLDSDLFTQCTFGTPPAPISEISKDLRDVDLGDLLGFDAIIHLAGLANDPSAI
jgi:nucleoside-diphosphate-sugar epimerase